MNTDVHSNVDQEDKPLTRADVEELLHQAGSSEKLKLIGLNLEGIDLTTFNLVGADLNGANLNFAKLSKANFEGADLSYAHLSKADLSRANLIGADLSGANLIGADLSGANLSGANLNRAILNGAILSEVQIGVTGAKLVSDNLSGVRSLDESSFRIRILEEPLTPPALTSILSAFTNLCTKCWLIAHGRFADLIEYTQTHDTRFVEETQLAFTRITYNSPFDASLKIDLSASNVADAIRTTIDAVAQRKQRLEKAELENKEKAQEIEHAKQKADTENRSAFLEQERQELALERERLEILEKRLDVQKKGIMYAFEIAAQTVEVLQPDADEQTKVMLIQTLVPTVLQLQNGKGLELILPLPQRNDFVL
jgi:uncharacterized protein YjbI with pentapeptide repeats